MPPKGNYVSHASARDRRRASSARGPDQAALMPAVSEPRDSLRAHIGSARAVLIRPHAFDELARCDELMSNCRTDGDLPAGDHRGPEEVPRCEQDPDSGDFPPGAR